ncbi:hypothetical protein [Streptomyces sp. or3]|uniref:hypothetical protein n=1 Tax=Streptomyces sp. or3 TaxID=1828020 RepID=UPI00117CC4D0|nr:hypothetical protein [Streptomyces sp. or3]
MSTHLHSLWQRAMDSAAGDDPFSRLRRSSLEVAASDFDIPLTPEVRTAAVQLRLSDESSDASGAVAALEASDFLRRVQRAVARLAKARRSRLADVVRLTSGDFDLARLNVATASLGSWVVDLSYPVVEEDSPASASSTLWTEIGVVELIRALPEDDGDDQSIDSIDAASPVIRRAVSDLVSKVSDKRPELSLSLSVRRTSGEVLRSSVTPRQASILREKLAVAREERGIIRVRGRLDGLRTRRQIFYLEVSEGREIHGFVDESLMPAVRENLDHLVEVELETFVMRSRSGRASQRQYRLMRVGQQQSQLPAGDDVKF